MLRDESIEAFQGVELTQQDKTIKNQEFQNKLKEALIKAEQGQKYIFIALLLFSLGLLALAAWSYRKKNN